MLLIIQILVRTLALGASAVLIACGQQGPLYFPPTATVQRVNPPVPLLPTAGNPTTILQPTTPASVPQNK